MMCDQIVFAFQDEVRSQDTVFVIVSVAVSKNGRDLAWQFFKDHWQEFMNRYQVMRDPLDADNRNIRLGLRRRDLKI